MVDANASARGMHGAANAKGLTRSLQTRGTRPATGIAYWSTWSHLHAALISDVGRHAQQAARACAPQPLTTQEVQVPWSLGCPMAENPPICAADRASKDDGDVTSSNCVLCETDCDPAAQSDPLLLLQAVLLSDGLAYRACQALAVAYACTPAFWRCSSASVAAPGMKLAQRRHGQDQPCKCTRTAPAWPLQACRSAATVRIATVPFTNCQQSSNPQKYATPGLWQAAVSDIGIPDQDGPPSLALPVYPRPPATTLGFFRVLALQHPRGPAATTAAEAQAIAALPQAGAAAAGRGSWLKNKKRSGKNGTMQCTPLRHTSWHLVHSQSSPSPGTAGVCRTPPPPRCVNNCIDR
jgi:hypothetical protein